MNLKNIIERNSTLIAIVAFTAFSVLLLSLIFTREAWIDESWFAAYSIHFLRTGEIADLNMARFTNELPHRFFFYFYALLQAPVYFIFGENLLAGRFITLIAAFTGLWAMFKIFKDYLHMERGLALSSTFLVAFTYYYVYPATQIRPDLIAVVFVLVGMVFLKKWMSREGDVWLVLTHLMFILAILLHMQAGFAWVGLLLFLAVNTLKVESKLKTFFVSLPAYIVIGALFYMSDYFDENMAHYYDTFFGAGNMAGHKGGMVMSMIDKFQNGEYLKFGIRLAMTVLFVLNFLYYVYIKKISIFLNDAFFLVAGASFGSWLLTTTQINDYHAVWLTMPFMLMAYHTFQKKSVIRWANTLFFIALIVPTFLYAFKTVKANPLKEQSYQVIQLNKKYDLNHKKLFIDRDLMWYFSFGKNVTYRLEDKKSFPEYMLLRKGVHKKESYTEFEKRKYRLIDETSMFLLYKKEE